jgi:cytochrome b involved in lipid metabolism
MAVIPSDVANCCYDNETGTVVNKYTLEEGGISDPREYLCDACPFCADVCERASPNPMYEVCQSCNMKLKTRQQQEELNPSKSSSSKQQTYTSCQIARHDTVGSCWVVMGKDVLDASSVIIKHPGGIKSILRKAGTTTDTSKDFQMHSSNARSKWKSLRIGMLIKCPKEGGGGAEDTGGAPTKSCKVS